MPLDREHLTARERSTLLTFAAINLGYGLSFVCTSVPSLMTSPAYGTLSHAAPIHVWGWLFVVVGGIQALTLAVTHNRWGYAYALALAALLGAVFTATLFVGAFAGNNLWTAPWLCLFYTFVNMAAAAALIFRES